MEATHIACFGSLVIVALLACLPLTNAELPIPNGMNYIGVGYNLVLGNPDGDSQNAGGVDPGLHASRNILELTYDKGKKSKDNRFRVPDEVEFLQRSTAVTSKESKMFYGTESYAKTLSTKVTESASLDVIFASVKFAGSHDYKQISEDEKAEGYVYSFEETTENLGRIRYLSELAEHDQFGVSRNFYAAVCELPVAYDKMQYMRFIDEWGTHVVTQLDVGIRSGKTYRATRSSFVLLASEKNSDSVSLEGHYKIASASLSVNMDKFTKNEASEKKFGTEERTYTLGSKTLNEPISLTLLGLNEMLEDNRYWTKQDSYEGTICPTGWDRPAIAANILTAFKGYAEYKRVISSSDPEVRIPLTWPDGEYALPKPARTGTCPNTDYLKWDEGNRVEITEYLGANWWDKSQELTDDISQGSLTMYYCVKTVAQISKKTSWEWMPGSYCIYRFGNNCPEGFQTGYLKYDDEDKDNNNRVTGIVPDGEYTNHFSLVHFCCRNDRSPMRPIYLPTDTSFYLIRRYDTCQKVHGMTDTAHFIEVDTEFDNNQDEMYGAVPQPGVKDHSRIMVYYCYYQPAATAKRIVEVDDDEDNHGWKRIMHGDREDENVDEEEEVGGVDKKVETLLDLLEKLAHLEN